MRRYVTCPAGHRNDRTGGRRTCAFPGCSRALPKKRVTKHKRTLRDDSYAVYLQVARDIHGVTDESCCVCGKPRTQEKHHDRDHEHDPASPFFGKPRGLACPGRQGCNIIMPKGLHAAGARELVQLLEGPLSGTVSLLISQGMTLERARLIAAYLERVESFYAAHEREAVSPTNGTEA